MTTYIDPGTIWRQGRNAMPRLVYEHRHHIAPSDYWELVRSAWTGAEWPLHKLTPTEWRRLFRFRTGRRFMMDDGERAHLRSLPAEIRVYRGEQGNVKHRWSWTLDRARAEWFGTRFPHLGSGRLLMGTVLKRQVVAYLNSGRGEQEILVTSRVYVDTDIPLAVKQAGDSFASQLFAQINFAEQ